MTRLLITIVCGSALIACDNKTPPPPPVVNPPSAVETINGSERIGWDQPAADAVELAAIRYAIYVDDARVELAGVACATAASSAGFACAARLPPMSAGAHTLQVAAFVDDGGLLESARSASLRVNVVAQTASASVDRPRTIAGSLVVDGLDAPTALAFAPDGRLFVAERHGRIRVVRDGQLLAEPAISLADELGREGQLLALALDPQFARTGHVFAIYTAPARTGEPTFVLARFREVSNTLGDRAVLMDGIAAAPRAPAAALRFGPDGKLYAAFDDGGDARRRGDAGSPNGKILRLNADGTTPADADGGSPVYAGGYGAPVAIDWDPPTGTLWIADRDAGSWPFAFYRGDRYPDWSGRLLTGIVAVGPDGAIYYGTARAVGRLVPGRGP